MLCAAPVERNPAFRQLGRLALLYQLQVGHSALHNTGVINRINTYSSHSVSFSQLFHLPPAFLSFFFTISAFVLFSPLQSVSVTQEEQWKLQVLCHCVTS